MARAAAKRNRGAGKAARPVADAPKRDRRKAEKTLEDELFFTRLRGHAKWAFALLAIVFAGSFVFLGVGSGNAGLGDVFSNVFTGGSAPSIEELQDKLAKNPRDKAVLTDLAQALERDGRYAEAVAAYRTYLATRPRDEDVLASLALVYQTQASAAANDASFAQRDASLAAPGAQFRPGAGALGQALGSFVDPLAQAASADAEQRFQEAVGRYQAANREALGVYKQLSELSPNDSRLAPALGSGSGRSWRDRHRGHRLQAVREALPDRPARRRRAPEDQGARGAEDRAAGRRPSQRVRLAPVRVSILAALLSRCSRPAAARAGTGGISTGGDTVARGGAVQAAVRQLPRARRGGHRGHHRPESRRRLRVRS